MTFTSSRLPQTFGAGAAIVIVSSKVIASLRLSPAHGGEGR
jgi:hypothetical protein